MHKCQVNYAVPIAFEGRQNILLHQLKRLGFHDAGSFANATTAEIIAVLIYPATKKYMVYRHFSGNMSETVDNCFFLSTKITMAQALKLFVVKRRKHEKND